MVLAVGEAGGSIDGVAWQTPAAWKALIREGKVMEWRVFADNKPVYEILRNGRWHQAQTQTEFDEGVTLLAADLPNCRITCGRVK